MVGCPPAWGCRVPIWDGRGVWLGAPSFLRPCLQHHWWGKNRESWEGTEISQDLRAEGSRDRVTLEVFGGQALLFLLTVHRMKFKLLTVD